MSVSPPKVSKRLRFEILRRDNHACRYCGQSAPFVKLTIDHVVPITLGGTNDPSNLVTACVDCNNGKASTQPDADFVAQIDEDSTRWEQAKRMARNRDSLYTGFEDELDDFYAAWHRWVIKGTDTTFKLPEDWRSNIRRWLLRDFPIADIVDSVTIALGRQGIQADERWRYFCGVVWNRVRECEALEKQYYDELRQEAGPDERVYGEGWEMLLSKITSNLDDL